MADEAWLELLDWLETKGFDRRTLKVELRNSPAGGGRKLVATEDIYPRQALIRLPHSSLLNRRTIAPLYNLKHVEQLDGTQLLSLHLALHRFNKDATVQAKDYFLPYIRTLPHDFNTVPLWREVVSDTLWHQLVKDNLLPYGLKIAVQDVSKRFWADWNHVQSVYEPASLNVQDFCWGWLCVNSRCIYYDLESPTKEDNVTLAAIIDGNHNSSRTERIVDYEENFCLLSSEAPSIFANQLAKNTILMPKGSEILYSYSTHSEYVLLAEYGFVLGMPANIDSVLDVTDVVFKLFNELEPQECELKKAVLQANNYWDEYHFMLLEGKVDVSYRITVALALYHLHIQLKEARTARQLSPRKRAKRNLTDSSEIVDEEAAFKPFYDLINGEVDEISTENVEKTQATLKNLSKRALFDSQKALARLADGFQHEDALLDMVKTIWEGQEWLARQYSGKF